MISSCALAKYKEKENKNNIVEKQNNTIFVTLYIWKNFCNSR
jgi:hypothetical protein